MSSELPGKIFEREMDMRQHRSFAGISARILVAFLALLALIGAPLAAAADQRVAISPQPDPIPPTPIIDDFTGLKPAPSSICVAGRSYRGCCSDHQGVKDITDEYLICKDDAPSRTCAGVTVSLKGCCKGHNGIYGVDTNGVVICNDQSSSPSCKIGLCKNDRS